MKIKLIIGASLLIALGTFALFLNNRHAEPAQSNVDVKTVNSGKPLNLMQQAEPQDASKATNPIVTSASDHPADEQRATQQIYLAHAPLRQQEVANPDSETNRVILQTMVQKALVHKSETIMIVPAK